MADREERQSYDDAKEEEDYPTYEDLHSPMSRTITSRTSHSHAHMEASDFVNLPYRTFSSQAAIEEEYIDEHPGGQVLKEIQSHRTGRIERFEFVTWTTNDPENPKNMNYVRKWIICLVVCMGSVCV